MEDKKAPVTLSEKEKQKEELNKKRRKKAANEKFKAEYFAYYDDIKISDRQDW